MPSLTLGLMGLDILHLRVLATSSDDPKEKRNAQKGDSITQSRNPLLWVLKLLTFTSSRPDAEGPTLDPCGEYCVFHIYYNDSPYIAVLGSPSLQRRNQRISTNLPGFSCASLIAS